MRCKHHTAKLSGKKLSLLGVARKRLNLDEDDWRTLLLQYGGATSARQIDERGFSDVMDRLRALGFTSTARGGTFGERPGMASPGQVAMIKNLWKRAVDHPTETALNAFLTRHSKVSALRFLPAEKAQGVIVALKSMESRRKAKSGAEANQLPAAP